MLSILENKTAYRILYIDSSKNFRNAREIAMKKIAEMNPGSYKRNQFIEKLKSFEEIGEKDWSHIIVNTEFVNESFVNFMQEVIISATFCMLVLIVTSESSVFVRKTIGLLDSISETFKVGFILGDNVSDQSLVSQSLR